MNHSINQIHSKTRIPMNIVLWADKGGVGKSTLATSLAATLGMRLIDLDPQGDSLCWGRARREAGDESLEVMTISTAAEAKAALTSAIGTVVDCPPGQSEVALTAVALADLLVIPCRTGDADMVALGRSLDLARRVRRARPEVQIGLVLNLARETGRAKGVEAALRAQAGQDYVWLGRLGARVGIEEAYASRRTLLEAGGAVAHEFRAIRDMVQKLNESYDSLAS
jgi:cellulose biosynthesis protein BcsQ